MKYDPFGTWLDRTSSCRRATAGDAVTDVELVRNAAIYVRDTVYAARCICEDQFDEKWNVADVIAVYDRIVAREQRAATPRTVDRLLGEASELIAKHGLDEDDSDAF